MGYGASPAVTPVDSKIGYRGQQGIGSPGGSYDGEGRRSRRNQAHRGAEGRATANRTATAIPNAPKTMPAPQVLPKPAPAPGPTLGSLTPKPAAAPPLGGMIGADGEKVGKVMHEYKHGELHSGSPKGPKVKNRKQAIAIALSEQRKQDKE